MTQLRSNTHADEPDVGELQLSLEQQRLILGSLESILASSYFKRSKRYPALLAFVVRNTLAGNLAVLRERIVGVEVFDRQSDYDPVTDSVVRMAASEVRKRLTLYYSVNPDAPVRIHLPNGSYAVEFQFRAETADSHIQSRMDSIRREGIEELPDNFGQFQPGPHVPAQAGTRRRWVFPFAVSIATFLALAIWWVARSNLAKPVESFWAPVLKSHSTILITIGTPYKPGPTPWESGLPDNALSNYIHSQPNNPVPDISAANSINQYFASQKKKSEIRMASSTQFADLRQAPAVLIGGGPMSPWTMRLGSNLRFQFRESDGGAVHWIGDTLNPANLNWKVDLRLPFDQIGAEYALVTRQLNPTTGQWWVGVGGTTLLGTVEAERMLLDQAQMKMLEAQLPRGWARKNLQFVVEFTVVNGGIGNLRILATDVS